MNTHRRHFAALMAVISMLCACLNAHAQVLVYNLSFNNTGTTVNYAFVQGGYLVIDVAGSSFSSVMVLTDPNTLVPYSATGLISGSYNTVLNATNAVTYGVASASGGGGQESVGFQVVGPVGSTGPVGGGLGAQFAQRMRGTFYASSAQSSSNSSSSSNSTTSTTSNATTTTSSNSTSNQTTSGNSTFTYGFAGQSTVRAGYNRGLTRQVNGQQLSSSAALQYLTQILQNNGIPPQASATASPSPSPTN